MTFTPQILETNMPKLLEQVLHPGLYIISTPIGNIFDISIRALHIFEKAKCIFAEDTRVTRKILNFYNIKSQVLQCNEYTNIEHICEKITSHPDDIFALTSDAGTPLISDPGYSLVNWCISKNVNIYAVPGACSAIVGISLSGFPANEFCFIGFLPKKSSEKKDKLEKLRKYESSLIFFESPNRLLDTLKGMFDVLGNRKVYVGRELTKFFEEHKRGTLTEVIEYYSLYDPCGEIVIVLEGAQTESKSAQLEDHSGLYSQKDITEYISRHSKLPKSLIYDLLLRLKNHDNHI